MLRKMTAAGCALVLAGCAAAGPDYVAPTLPMPSGFSTKSTTDPAVRPETAWWLGLRDKTLDGLIEVALATNLDVAEAIERVFEAKALARVNNSGAYPSIGADASFARISETTGFGSDATNQWSGEANASWEIDLFGRYRRQREMGKADVAAAVEDVNTARLSLLGNVAETYVRARGYQARLGIARETLVAWRNTLELTRAKFDAGSVSRLQLAQAEAEVASTSADIPTLETSLHESIMELGVLLGKQPASILPLFKRGGPIPNPRVSVGAGIPANILRDRPDIRKAEKNLASATAQIGVGLAQLYPSLSLSGLISTTASSVANLGSAGAVSWSFGPGIDLAIFDGGQRRAQVEVYRSQALQRYLAWKSSVLSAVADVEKTLSAYLHERQKVTALKRSVEQYAIAAGLADERYRAGSRDFLDVLEARRSLYAARDALANSQMQLTVDFIALSVAFGGGWSAASTLHTAAP